MTIINESIGICNCPPLPVGIHTLRIRSLFENINFETSITDIPNIELISLSQDINILLYLMYYMIHMCIFI